MNPLVTPLKKKGLFNNSQFDNKTSSHINLNPTIQNFTNINNNSQPQYKRKSKNFHQSSRKQQILSFYKQSRQKQYQTQIKIKNKQNFIRITQNILNDLVNKQYYDELEQIIKNKNVKLDKENFQYIMSIFQKLYQNIIEKYQNRLQTQRQASILQQSFNRLLQIILTHNSSYQLKQLIFPCQALLNTCLQILGYKNSRNYFLPSTIKLIFDIILDFIILAFNKQYLIQNGFIIILSQIKYLSVYQEKIIEILLNLFNEKTMKIKQEKILGQIKDMIVHKQKGIYSDMIKGENGQYYYQNNKKNNNTNNYHTTYQSSYSNNTIKKNEATPIISKKYFSQFHELINDLNCIITLQLKKNPITHQLSLHLLQMLKVSYQHLFSNKQQKQVIAKQQKQMIIKQQVIIKQQKQMIISPKQYMLCIKVLMSWLQQKPLCHMLTMNIDTIIIIYLMVQKIVFSLQQLHNQHKTQKHEYSLLSQQQRKYYITKKQPKQISQLQAIIFLFTDVLQSIVTILTDKYTKIVYQNVCEIVYGLAIRIFDRVEFLECSSCLLLVVFNIMTKISILQQQTERKFLLSNQQRLTLQYHFQRYIFRHIDNQKYHFQRLFQNIENENYNYRSNQEYNYSSNNNDMNDTVQLLKYYVNKIFYIYYQMVVYTKYTQNNNPKYPQVQTQIMSLINEKLLNNKKKNYILHSQNYIKTNQYKQKQQFSQTISIILINSQIVLINFICIYIDNIRTSQGNSQQDYNKTTLIVSC